MMEMKGMPAEAPAPQQPEQPAQGGASQLVSDIHDKMSKLMGAVSQSGAVDESDKAKLAQVIQQYEAFVNGLGGAKQPAAPASGNVPMEAGAANVRQAM